MKKFLQIPVLWRGQFSSSFLLVLLLLLLAGVAQAQNFTLSGVVPAPGTTAAPRSTNIVATFNQTLSGSPATQQGLKVFSRQAGGLKAGTTTISGNTLTFDPATDFKPGETVAATVTGTVQSSGGVVLANPQVFEFTTATVPAPALFTEGSEVTSGIASKRNIADFDGDGDLDILLLYGPGCFCGVGNMQVLFNSGNGTFTSGPQTPFTYERPNSVGVGDLDNDGDLDFATSNSYTFGTGRGGSVMIGINNGQGNFAIRTLSTPSSGFTTYSTLNISDIGRDGDLDISAGGTFIVAPGGPETSVSITFYNDGTGRFSTTQTGGFSGASGEYSASSRSNADQPTNSTGTTVLRSLVVGGVPGDVNGDGYLDEVAPGVGNSVDVYLNDGTGSYGSKRTIAVGSAPQSVALGDLDGDGTLDFISWRLETTTTSVRLNKAPAPALSTYRLNAGGGALATSRGAFEADQYYSGTNSTLTSAAPIAGTTDDALYQSERYSTNGLLTYALPVPNGTYTVALHFAEIYWTQPGQRVFDIQLEGNTVRDNYDIVREVGPLTATTQTFTVSVNDGVLNLNLVALPASGGVDQAKLSALEVAPATAVYRLKAGSELVGNQPIQTARGVFMPDQYYTAASLTSATSYPILNTPDPALYRSERYSTNGTLGYALPVPNGQYTVVVHFAEIYWTQPGQRVFDIQLEGNTVRDNYDILAKVGPRTPTTETYTVTVTDGVLNLDLVALPASGGVDQAKLSALEVFRDAIPGVGARPALANALRATTPQLDVYPNPENGAAVYLRLPVGSIAQPVRVSLLNSLGQSVLEQPLTTQQLAGPLELRLPQLPAGVYSLQLFTTQGVMNKRLVVK